MSRRGSLSRRRRRAGWCAVAIAAFGLAGVPAGAATPTVPGAPTITSATAGVQDATVAFTAPSDDGGSPVFAYTATCTSTNGKLNATRSGAASPLRVGGMSVGLPYTCRVAARNVVGLGPYSVASASVVPLVSVRRAKPGAPVDVHAVPEIGGIKIDYELAPEPAGSRLTHEYRGKCTSTDNSMTVTRRVHFRSLVVEPLTPGQTYTCKVAASNGNGFGPYSASSNPAVPLSPLPTLGAPTITSIASASDDVTISFDPPAHDGGHPITHYGATCTSSDGGATQNRSGRTSPLVVLGLSPGDTYTCTVIAHNHSGDGPPSAPSPSFVVPAD